MFQANILVDKDGAAWIAGLGNTSILPHSTARTVREGRTSTDRLPHSRTPEPTWPGRSPNLTDPTQPTKADDVCAFGAMAWEVQTESLVQNCSVC